MGLKAGVGTASTALRIAPSEQQDAQALHLCLLAWLKAEGGVESAGAAETSSNEAATW